MEDIFTSSSCCKFDEWKSSFDDILTFPDSFIFSLILESLLFLVPLTNSEVYVSLNVALVLVVVVKNLFFFYSELRICWRIGNSKPRTAFGEKRRTWWSDLRFLFLSLASLFLVLVGGHIYIPIPIFWSSFDPRSSLCGFPSPLSPYSRWVIRNMILFNDPGYIPMNTNERGREKEGDRKAAG